MEAYTEGRGGGKLGDGGGGREEIKGGKNGGW